MKQIALVLMRIMLTNLSLCSLMYVSGTRHDISLVLPIRQTASIFKQPVTLKTNHTTNRIKADPKQDTKETPKQVIDVRKDYNNLHTSFFNIFLLVYNISCDEFKEGTLLNLTSTCDFMLLFHCSIYFSKQYSMTI